VQPVGSSTAAAAAAPPPAAAAAVVEDDHDVGAEVLCVVCWEGVREVGLLHGDLMHLCMCKGCAVAYGPGSECPMCRQTVEQVIVLRN
jgi:hypothetical protein